DTLPYAVEREIEDLAALLDLAGGSAGVFGYSSGAMLSLQAAAAGLPITRLGPYDAPYLVDATGPDHSAALRPLLASGQRRARGGARRPDARPGRRRARPRAGGVLLRRGARVGLSFGVWSPLMSGLAQRRMRRCEPGDHERLARADHHPPCGGAHARLRRKRA